MIIPNVSPGTTDVNLKCELARKSNVYDVLANLQEKAMVR